jgi:peptidoglycan hydrolase-like protein with peptidoglycan-binding domain
MTSRSLLTAFTLMVLILVVSLIYFAAPLFARQAVAPIDPATLAAAYQARLMRAQEALTELGYDPGPADGIFRPQTAASLREFQRVQGLGITGRANAETLERLGIEVPPARLKRQPWSHPLGWVDRNDRVALTDQQQVDRGSSEARR